MWCLPRIYLIWYWSSENITRHLHSCLGGWSYLIWMAPRIIISLYKRKGSRSGWSNYRGITLLSVPGKVFADAILSRISPTLLTHRRSHQSGFTLSFHMWLYSNFKQHCTTTIKLLLSDLCALVAVVSNSFYNQYICEVRAVCIG